MPVADFEIAFVPSVVMFTLVRSQCPQLVLGSVIKQSRRRRCNEDATEEIQFMFCSILRDYSNLFNLYNVAELFRRCSRRNSVQFQMKKGKFTFMCSRVFTFSRKL